jgi:hypothetical protein
VYNQIIKEDKVVRKRYVALVGGVLLLIGVGGAFAFIAVQRINPDKVFMEYLKNYARASNIASEEEFAGTGAKGKAMGVIDVKEKSLLINAQLECTAKISGKSVTVDASVQNENTKGYVRLNAIKGELLLEDGSSMKLSELYRPAVGKWYMIPDDDPALKAQLDSGIYVFTSAVIAPGYNIDSFVPDLIDNKALEYVFTRKTKDGDYEYQVTANKQQYEAFLQENFPNLSNRDLVLDSVFGDQKTKLTTLVTDKTGKLISEKYSDENVCKEIVEIFAGEAGEGMPNEITISSNLKALNEINIPTVRDARPLDSLMTDLGY